MNCYESRGLGVMRKISIIEDEEGAYIEILPDSVRYEFDSFDDAMEALPNLKEI